MNSALQIPRAVSACADTVVWLYRAVMCETYSICTYINETV